MTHRTFVVCLMFATVLIPALAHSQEKIDKLSFRVPPGMDRLASLSHASATIVGRENYQFGTGQTRDRFTIKVTGAHGGNLDTYESTVLGQRNTSIQHVVEFVKQNPAGAGGQKLIPKDIHIDVKRTSIGKIPAYELVTHSAVIVAGVPSPYVSRTIMSLYKDRYYEVEVGYAVARAAKVKPQADALLASLRFDDVP